MRIKLKHLTKSDRRIAQKRRQQREAEAAERRRARIVRQSEFTRHVSLFDSVHPHWQFRYTVKFRGWALVSDADIATEHRVAPRS